MAKFDIGAIVKHVSGDTYTQSDVFCHEYYSAWRHLIYDPINGTFFNRKVKRNVGSVCKHNGYVKLWVGGKKYNAHRIAWVMMHGVMPFPCIDHINRIKNDNRIINLRIATASQNMANSSLARNNTHGVKGVYFFRRKKLWTAQISVNGKRISLGYYREFNDAKKARNEAEKKYFGDFIHNT